MNKKRDSFTEAHSRYYPVVFSAVYSKVGNADDAEDICQEVFIKCFEKFDEIKNVRKWLYGALRLSVFEYYRRKHKRDVDIDEVFGDVSLTFVNGFREARMVISEAVENIESLRNEEDRLVFDLVAVHKFSCSQAGKQLGLT